MSTLVSSYGRRIVVDADFENTVERTINALRAEGLDVLSRFDVREYLRRTLPHDFRRYVLLQVSAPPLMLEALLNDLGVGSILPVTIAIHELADGETAIVASEPFGPVLEDRAWRSASPALADVADREAACIGRALARMQHPIGEPHRP